MIASLPKCSEKSIDMNMFMYACLLWCEGPKTEKAEALFQLLNPIGQYQGAMSATDKEWKPTIIGIFTIASSFIYNQTGK